MAGHAALVLEDLPTLLVDRPMFKDLGQEQLSSLLRGGQLLDLKPNEKLDKSSDETRLYFVITGQVGVVRNRKTGLEAALKRSHLPNPGREYLLHMVDGDFFSDRFLTMDGVAEEFKLACVAVMRSLLLQARAVGPRLSLRR